MIPPSRRTMISEIAARTIRLRVAAVAPGCDQARSRSAPSAMSCCRSGIAKRWRTPRDQGRDVTLDLGNRLQGLVPAALQLASDEPVGWIDGIVLPAGMGGLIAGLLQGEFQLPLSRRGLGSTGPR